MSTFQSSSLLEKEVQRRRSKTCFQRRTTTSPSPPPPPPPPSPAPADDETKVTDRKPAVTTTYYDQYFNIRGDDLMFEHLQMFDPYFESFEQLSVSTEEKNRGGKETYDPMLEYLRGFSSSCNCYKCAL
ncbi:hypothetical protein OROHE_016748 [Orobanche hederae]